MKMTYLKLILLIGVIGFSLQLKGQSGYKSKDIVHIGDKLLKIPYGKLYLDNEKSFNVDGAEGKLILIDFFTTYCGSCIASFPKLNELQKENSKNLSIVLVSPEKEKRIDDFFSHNTIAKSNLLPVVMEDTILSKMFPFKSVPHVVWVKDDKVVAITHSDMINQENINFILAGNNAGEWPIKNDFPMLDTLGSYKNNLFSQIRGYEDDSPSFYNIDTIDGKWLNYNMKNVSILQSYLYAYSRVMKLPFIKQQRIIYEVSDRNRFENVNLIPNSQWLKEKGIVYEANLPLDWTEEERVNYVLNDLNNKLRLNIRIEDRPISAWVVSDSSNIEEKLTGQDISIVLTLLDLKDRFGRPIINEVKKKGRISIKGFQSFQDLREQLGKSGLKLKEEVKNTKVLVISDNETAGF